MKNAFFKNPWAWVIALMFTTMSVGFGQNQPVVGDVKPQSEVFDFPIWDELRQGQRDSAMAITWYGYLGLDSVCVWNAIEKSMARYSCFRGSDSIYVVKLDNGEHGIYRYWCHNRNKRELPTPKEGIETCPEWEMIFIYLPAKCPQDTPKVEKKDPPTQTVVVKCDSCCPADSLSYEFDPFAVADFERIGGQLHKGYGAGFEFALVWYHRNDKSEKWLKKPVGFYGGMTVYLSEKPFEFKPTCDSCGTNWIPVPENKPALRSDVFLGMSLRIFEWRGLEAYSFLELRYDWYDSRRKEAFLGATGVKARTGLRVDVNTPRKMAVVRSVQIEVGPQISSYEKPDKNPAASVGGFMTLRANFGARDEQTKREQDSIKRAQKYRQFQRDSIAAFKRDSIAFARDSALVDAYLLENPDTIQIDSVALAIDSAYTDPTPVSFFGKCVKPLPFSKYKRGQKLNAAKGQLLYSQARHNRIRENLKTDRKFWQHSFLRNIRQVEKDKARFERLQKKADRHKNRKAAKSTK